MKLKQYYPFVVPTISLALVLILAFRWYNLRTKRTAPTEITQVEIENLSQDDLKIIQGADDVSTVELEAESDQPILGQIRYKIDEDRVLVTLSADLPKLQDSYYQVWFVSGDKKPQPAFRLQLSKSGFIGSASVLKEQLPLEVLVTDQTGTAPEFAGKMILKGTIQAEKAE